MDRGFTMRRRWFLVVLLGVFFTVGMALDVDLSLDEKDSGFFLKPLFGTRHATNPNVDEHLFTITNPQGPVKVKAVYGPFEAEDMVSTTMLQASLGNHSTFLSNTVVDDMDISAHLVFASITQDRPILQVLFHASQSQMDYAGKYPKNKHSSTHWCLKLHVQHDREELTTSCTITQKENVCVSQETLPQEWWGESHVHSVPVYYSVYTINPAEGYACSDPVRPTQTYDEEEEEDEDFNVRSYVGMVTLALSQLTYQEVEEDQHILLYVPQKSYYPGSQFRVPVKLQKESDLELFVVRVKARHGIRIIGAEADNPEKWRITVDLNRKRRSAMVTAFIHNKDVYTKTDKVQEIFSWIFQVEEDTIDESPARIRFKLEYEMNSKMEEKYGSIQNRIIARIHVQHDNIYTIVPVIKSTELVNTAMLTGKMQNFLMRIYTLGRGGKVTDITSQTTCHSGDTDVLKVAESCNLVYLDGSETRGSPSVSVIAKYGRHTKFLFFKVWIPEVPLELELSDNNLSKIKAWKAPEHPLRSRVARDTDALTHPGLRHDDDMVMTYDEEEEEDEDEEDDEEDDDAASCHLRFQQAIVEVYAHFSMPDDSQNQYLTHRKAMFRITDLVRDKLRIADTTIATLSGNVVEVVRPGRTEVQVLSQLGRVIAAEEIRVGNNKVMVKDLMVKVVTGISLEANAYPELPGTLMAQLTRKELLQRKYQEGILDISVVFSDGATLPLSLVPPSDYFLDMDTLNNHVVAFGPMLASNQPCIIALGQGKGELLKLALELGDQCQRKKSRPLAVSRTFIEIDFSKDASEANLQNDGHFGSGSRFSSDRAVKEGGVVSDDLSDKTASGDLSDKLPDDHGYVESVDDGHHVSGGDGTHFEENVQPNHEAQQQQVSTTRGMTALEIGMYVLLGIFCLAIVVFMVNCMVFVWRYRRKHMPYEYNETIQNAHDWVWIGRATLERNAISTACAQMLMPESDFNGNQNNPALLAPPPAAGSTSTAVRSSGTLSNRNSMVSTYKGSECSIRITSNPHPDANANNENGAQHSTASLPQPVTRPTPIPSASSPSSSSFMSTTSDDEPVPLLPQPGPSNLNLRQLPPHNADACNNNMAIANSNHNANMAAAAAAGGGVSDVEWDYEAMGMTYEQLMQYFDNLKESTA